MFEIADKTVSKNGKRHDEKLLRAFLKRIYPALLDSINELESYYDVIKARRATKEPIYPPSAIKIFKEHEEL